MRSLAKGALDGFRRHRVPRMAAALAYYTLFSLAPLLILVFGIAGFVLRDDTARQTLFDQVESAAGAEMAATLADLVEARRGDAADDTVATVVGAVLLFIGASGVFLQLQDSLDTVWEVPLRETKGLIPTLRKRAIGFAAVVGLGVGLIVFTVGSSLIGFFASEISDALGAGGIIVQILNPVVALAGLAVVFGVIFLVMPNADVPWSVAWRGGAVTALLVAVGGVAIGLLFAFSDPGASFGRFAALIVLLVFIYYSTQVFFLGAEVTAGLSRRRSFATGTGSAVGGPSPSGAVPLAAVGRRRVEAPWVGIATVLAVAVLGVLATRHRR